MHEEARRFVMQMVGIYDLNREGTDVLEIGSLDVNGSVRDRFARCNYVGIDLLDGPGVDVVLCLELLEHARNAEQILRKAHELLKGGGFLVITCAGRGRPVHDGRGTRMLPSFYRNIEPEELGKWLAPFAYIRIIVNEARRDIYAIAEKRASDEL